MRRRVEHLGAAPCGQLAELEPLRERLGAVVARRNDVRMEVDEGRGHPLTVPAAGVLLAAQVELQRRSDHAELAQGARLELPYALAGDAEVGAHLF